MAKLTEANDKVLLANYIKLRESRAKRKAAFSEDDALEKSRMEKIENEFLRRFNERGTDSVSAKGVGTAYKNTRVSTTVSDMDALIEHVKHNDAYELLEKRVNKSAVQQYRDEHDDLPPGVNWAEIVTVNFRSK